MACTPAEPPGAEAPAPSSTRTSGPSPLSRDDLGRRVTLEGEAVNRKGGAVLQVGDVSVWIAGLEAWPEGYFTGGDHGRRTIVTGTLAEDHHLPVFVPKEDEPIRQGIPVPEGTDLEQASHRFVLRNARWD